MSTRSCVAVRSPEGYFRAIYVHSDGYIDGVGKGLLEHAPTYEAANKLLDRGGHSIIFPGHDPVAYIDKGESLSENAALILKTFGELSNFASESCGAVYLYIFDSFDDNGEWHVHCGSGWPDLGTVKDALENGNIA